MAKVLVVEDDNVNGMLLGYQIEDLGCDVERADDGVMGIEAVRRHRPDAVVLDLNMPRMDGYGFLRTLRGMVGGGEVPVIVVTAAMLDRQNLEDLRNLDVRRVLAKGSYSAIDLESAVRDAITRGAQ